MVAGSAVWLAFSGDCFSGALAPLFAQSFEICLGDVLW